MQKGHFYVVSTADVKECLKLVFKPWKNYEVSKYRTGTEKKMYVRLFFWTVA